jgi:hypothetical protein
MLSIDGLRTSGAFIISSDNGKTWSLVKDEAQSELDYSRIEFTNTKGEEFYSDDNGKTWFPVISETIISSANSQNIQISPNPVTESLNLNCQIEDEGVYRIYILNEFGTEVYNAEYTLAKGENILNIDLNNINSGYYKLVINTKNSSSIDFIKK